MTTETDYLKYRGKCKKFVEELIEKDPTLRKVRGYYHCPIWGEQEHWWCEKPDGTIVDPTKDQFPSRGLGQYVEFNGICICAECGTSVPEEKAHMAGPYPTCSSKCAMRLVGL